MAISSALGSSALLPAGLGFRNKLINGDFRINQRGIGIIATAINSTTINYSTDRWGTLTTCPSPTGRCRSTVVPFTLGSGLISGYEPINYLNWYTSTVSSTYVNSFVQRIEDVTSLANKTVTLSFWARNNGSQSVSSISFIQNFGTGGTPSADVTTTIAGTLPFTTSWARYTYTFVVPSLNGKTIGTTANTSYTAVVFNANSNVALNIDFWGLQLEENSQPTPFEQRPYGVELALCQRYYERVLQQMHIGMGVSENGTVATFINLPVVPKRSATLSISSIGTLYQHWGGTGGTYAGYGYSAQSSDIYVKYTSAPLAANAVGMMYLNGGYIEINVEL